MPNWLQYIEFFIGVVGLMISIATLYFAKSFHEKVRTLRQTEEFHSHRNEIIDKLEGFLNSITKDHLQDAPFQQNMILFIVDLHTGYEFFKPKTRRIIERINDELHSESPRWQIISEELVKLINRIKGEI